MGTEGAPDLIRLYPGQVVDSDPDGLLEYEAELLREAMKPRTMTLRFSIIAPPSPPEAGNKDKKGK
jgi:hypothetical protein